MVESRPIVQRKSDILDMEPLLDVARRKVATEGGSLRKALNALRAERKQRASEIAIADAPRPIKNEDGTFQRVSNDPRWPFGAYESGETPAPFGLSICGMPRTRDASNTPVTNRKGAAEARGEAREIIMNKLQRLGCDPITIMAEIALDREGTKAEVRLRAAAELASMVYPRLRGVETVQRQEKTIFVVALPADIPETSTAWLDKAHGTRQITQAVEEAAIEGEVLSSRDADG